MTKQAPSSDPAGDMLYPESHELSCTPPSTTTLHTHAVRARPTARLPCRRSCGLLALAVSILYFALSDAAFVYPLLGRNNRWAHLGFRWLLRACCVVLYLMVCWIYIFRVPTRDGEKGNPYISGRMEADPLSCVCVAADACLCALPDYWANTASMLLFGGTTLVALVQVNAPGGVEGGEGRARGRGDARPTGRKLISEHALNPSHCGETAAECHTRGPAILPVAPRRTPQP